MKKHLFFTLLLCFISVLCSNAEIKRDTYVYSIVDSDTLRLDRYVDNSVIPDSTGYPTMIYIHGGGFVGGSRINAAQELYADWLAKNGWQVLCIDYRLAGFSKNSDGSLKNPYHVKNALEFVRIACEDVITATNFALASDWNINHSRVCLSGGSAGAITALQTEYDLCNGEEYTKTLPKNFNYAGVISQAGAIASLTDSVVWAKEPCPIMFMHGTKDKNVPIDIESIGETYFIGPYKIIPTLQNMDVSYWKFIVTGADHVIAMLGLTDWYGQQSEFLKQFVLEQTPENIETTVNMETPPNMSSAQEMIKYVPYYILGYDKYLNQIDFDNKPNSIVY